MGAKRNNWTLQQWYAVQWNILNGKYYFLISVMICGQYIIRRGMETSAYWRNCGHRQIFAHIGQVFLFQQDDAACHTSKKGLHAYSNTPTCTTPTYTNPQLCNSSLSAAQLSIPDSAAWPLKVRRNRRQSLIKLVMWLKNNCQTVAFRSRWWWRSRTAGFA